MQVVTYYLLKIVLTVLLLFVVAFSVREIFRLWFVQRITLASFSYQKDGTEKVSDGKAFSQRVYRELRGLQRLLIGESKSQGKQEDLLTLPQNPSGQISTLVPPPMIPSLENNLTIPEMRGLPLSGLELKIQGVDLSSLAEALSRWANPPDEFTGSVVERSGSFDTLVEWHRYGGRGGEDLYFAADGHETLDDAAFATACNVLYLLMQDRDESFTQQLSRSEFELFARALRYYAHYRTLHTELRTTKKPDQARDSLDETDRIVSSLLERGVGKRFTPIYMLAAIVKIAKNDFTLTRRHLDMYLAAKPDDPTALALQKQLPETPKRVAAATTVRGAGVPQQKYRPVRPGVSAASTQTTGGTICCVVESKGDQSRYLLSTDFVFSGPPGMEIVQPSPVDGGASPRDLIGQIYKTVTLGSGVGTLAQPLESIKVNPQCFAIGAFKEVSEAKLGEKVTLVGRTSGVSKGVIVGINVSVAVARPDNTLLHLTGAIACEGVGGNPFSRPGDGGSPVVDSENNLIGMLYGGSSKRSFVVPIEPILEAFDVKLVTE